MIQTGLRRDSKFILAILISGLLTSLVFAQASKPAAPGGSPAPAKPATPVAARPSGPAAGTVESPATVVLKVGNQTYTKADVDFLMENVDPQSQHAIATQAGAKRQLGDRYATVVMLSQQRSLLREKLSDVLHRSFALGIRSFVLQASEAAILVSNGSKQYGYGPGNSQDMDAEQALSPT